MALRLKPNKQVSYEPVQSKDIEEDNIHLLSVGRIANMSLSKSISMESDDDIEKTHRKVETSMSDKIEAIKRRTSKSQRKRKKRIAEIKNCNDLWKWYWQHPFGHMPVLYFFICFLASFFFIIFWFMDQDTAFILCGLAGLVMTGYAIYKFKISIALKYQIDEYRQLNLKFNKENKKLRKEVDRVIEAHKTLKQTKRRLARANNNNKHNIKKFEQIEQNMKVAGEKAVKGMTSVHRHALEIREKWREEFLSNEREMLQAVYTRYERKHTNKSNLGMTEDDFSEFQKMLPRRYKTRFNRMGTFHTLANDGSMIDYQEFANALDVFAEMEVDEKDIEVLSPKHRRIRGQASAVSALSFGSLSAANSSDDDIEPIPTPTSVLIPQYNSSELLPNIPQ